MNHTRNERRSSDYQWNVAVPHNVVNSGFAFVYIVFGLGLSMLLGILLSSTSKPLIAVPPALWSLGFFFVMSKVRANDRVRLGLRREIAAVISNEIGARVTLRHLQDVARLSRDTGSGITQDVSRSHWSNGRTVTVTMLADGNVSAVAR